MNHYHHTRRYSSPLERPAPRSMLASPAFWFFGSCSLVIWWCVLAALAAHWGWL